MALKPADPLAQITDPGIAFKNPDQQQFLRQFRDTLSDAIGSKAGRTTSVPFIMLDAPNGTTYKITVDNSGTVSATAVP